MFFLQATSVNIIVGSHVWVEDPELAWIDGEVFKIAGDEVHVHTTNGKTVSFHWFNLICLIELQIPRTNRIPILCCVHDSY